MVLVHHLVLARKGGVSVCIDDSSGMSLWDILSDFLRIMATILHGLQDTSKMEKGEQTGGLKIKWNRKLRVK